MNIFSLNKQQALMALFVVAVSTIGSFTANAADFTAITDGVDQSITAININPNCNGVNGKMPNTIFTIESGNDGVTVTTSPADLFIVSSSSGTLSFAWNPAVASSASSTAGGVRINLPASQLKSVTVGGGYQAQILDGFTSVTSLESSGGATLRATFTSSSSTDFTLDNSGGGQMYVKSNVAITGGSIPGGSQAWVETPSYSNVNVSGGSGLSVKGDVGSGDVSGGATLTLTGTITGSVTNSGGATVNAPSCDGVSSSGGANCNANSQSVNVDVSTQDETISGTSTCFGGGGGGGFSFTSTSSATDSKTITNTVAAIAAATTGAAVALLI